MVSFFAVTMMTVPSSTPTAASATDRPSPLIIWLTAARPHTLTASLAPCIVAYAANRPPLSIQILWTCFCLSVQLGTNLHNDYADFIHGADDKDKRVGQARATSQGWLSPETTCRAATGILLITLFCGLSLVGMCPTADALERFPYDLKLLVIVLSSIFCAFAYTGGPYPFGWLLGDWSIAYRGLGDLFVLLYFGYAATLTIPFILMLRGRDDVDWVRQFVYGTQVGLLATNIIVVNNLRDRHTDVNVNKRTTAVRFGRRFSLMEYRACVYITFGLVLLDFLLSGSMARLVPLASLPMALKELKSVSSKEGADLNEHVGGAAKVQLLFCLLLSFGIFVSCLRGCNKPFL